MIHFVNMGGVSTIWPFWCTSIGGAIRQGAVIRAVCSECGTIFDVDLIALRDRRGPGFSLIDQHTQCRISRCRGNAFFIAAGGMYQPYQILTTSADASHSVAGRRPIDLEPPSDPPRGPAAAAHAA
ncbi:MAG: hypothetical protein ACM3ZV_07305 [Bacillota bacterium]